MKKKTFLHFNSLFIALTCVFFLYGCERHAKDPEDLPEQENKENFDMPAGPSKELVPSYEFINGSSILQGTNWKLTNIIKEGKQLLINPDIDKMSYTLWFYTDGNLLFHTSRNMINAYYKADKDTNLIRIINLSGIRHLTERDIAGVEFWQYLMDADVFELNGNELKIFVDNDSYLLLKSINGNPLNISHLHDTRWVLDTLTEVESGKQYDVDWNKYDCYKQLIVWFTSDGLFTGRSLGNDFGGNYIAGPTTIKLTGGSVTQVGEPELGMIFLEALLQENSFVIKENKLTLRGERFTLNLKNEML